ncbi:MAG: methionine--tRNA ligase [Bacilli bacterium]
MNDKKKFYITTPIYYPSDNFHIGHCYTTIIADAIARYKRLEGYDTFFLTGTDEHGQKIQKKAEDKGISPKEYVDVIVENAKDLWKSLGISYDKFIRTTDWEHVVAVQKIFKKLYDQGDIYKGEYKGLYCTPCESFWTESQLDENGNCPDCHREVHEVSEEAYFFKLSKYQKRLEEFLESNPDFIQPISRKNEMLNNFIKPGLEDLCVSRTSFDWGIPVTFDDKHVVYVWIDALSNYISALGYLSEDDSLFKRYWPADLHIVGKEIVRFHTIIWPIMLMALDLPLPKQVFGHGWLIINGGKISKSLGNYKDPREYISLYGVDAVRYFVLREVPFGNDGNFSEEALINRTNADLANVLGNLVNRTIGMVNKYFDGIVIDKKINEDIDTELINFVLSLKDRIEDNMNKLEISVALDSIFEVYRRCNKYIDETMPWVLAKDESKKDRLATVLYNLIESIRIATVYLQAFLPDTAKKIFTQINTDKIDYDSVSTFGLYSSGTKVNTPEVLFKRIEKE